MARSSYVADLAGALDQTIAELEREAGGAQPASEPAPAARGSGGEGKRTTGAPKPSVPPPAPAPVPAAPPQQEEGAASAPAAGAYGGAAASAPYAPRYPGQAPYAPAPAAPPPDVIAGNLSTQIRRLEELRRWVRDDPTFGRLVDNMIGQQVQSAERRQRFFTAAFSIVSLVVGWLLPVLVPITSVTNLHLPH